MWSNHIINLSFLICMIATTPLTADDCGHELVESQGSVKSPGYPESPEDDSRYPDNAYCHWHLNGTEATLIRAKFTDVAIEFGDNGSNTSCNYDYVNVSITSLGMRSFCGGRPPADELRGLGSMDIYFKSDDVTGYRGFQLFYMKIDDYDPCESYPCVNSVCWMNDNFEPICNCTDGYEGILCNQDVDECASSPCVNGGNCTDEVNGFTCACPTKYDGTTCEIEKPDPCVPNPCENEGECISASEESFNCTCATGYEGDLCESLSGCGDPGIDDLEEGRRFEYLSVLDFSCKENFYLVGGQFIYCQQNGEWSNIPPGCQLKEELIDNRSDFEKHMSWYVAVIVLVALFLVTLLTLVLWIRFKRPWSSPVKTLRNVGSDVDDADIY